MNKKIGLKEAMSIGIGGMVGGGIFAVLGLAVSLAQGGTPLAFLLAGVLTLLTSYSYVKLSQAFPDRGGTVKFVNRGFWQNSLQWRHQQPVVGQLYYHAGIICLGIWILCAQPGYPHGPPTNGFSSLRQWHHHPRHLINYYSIEVVGKVESYAVVIKLVILISFVFVGVYGLFGSANVGQLSMAHWESPLQLIAAGMVIFVAYEGFELIANAAPDIESPDRNIPRAYYFSVAFVMLLYIVIAAVTVGSLPFGEIAKAQDYVLAEAASPLLGKTGFTIITIAALISTFSAINASLYGGSRVSYEIAEDDELPHELTSLLWNHPVGLIITAALTLFLQMHLPWKVYRRQAVLDFY